MTDSAGVSEKRRVPYSYAAAVFRLRLVTETATSIAAVFVHGTEPEFLYESSAVIAGIFSLAALRQPEFGVTNADPGNPCTNV